DELVVCHVELDNPARYSGRDICNLSADGAVPRPGSGDIVLPCQNRDQDGDQCDGERRKAPSDREPQTADGTARYPRRRRWSRGGVCHFCRAVPRHRLEWGGRPGDIVDARPCFTTPLMAKEDLVSRPGGFHDSSVSIAV